MVVGRSRIVSCSSAQTTSTCNCNVMLTVPQNFIEKNFVCGVLLCVALHREWVSKKKSFMKKYLSIVKINFY